MSNRECGWVCRSLAATTHCTLTPRWRCVRGRGGAWVLAVQSYIVCLLYTPPVLYSVLYYSYMFVRGTVMYSVWYPVPLTHLQYPLLTSSTPCSPPVPLAHPQYSCICCEMGVLDHAAEVGLQSDWSECISLAVSHLQEQSGCVLTRLHLAQLLWTVVGDGGRRALTQICKDIISE